jgi:L-lactate dehydrogenase (cytochrome)
VQNLTNVVTQLTSVTARDVEWIRERWKGRLVLKGVMRGDECGHMLELGVDGIIVSNHGGRSLDGVRPTIEILPEVVHAVAGRVPVLVDGGVRRGSDVVKALALGATACLVGRPYMFGLAVAGEAGVLRVLEIFAAEIEQTMGLLGCATVADIDRDNVALADVLPPPRGGGSSLDAILSEAR